MRLARQAKHFRIEREKYSARLLESPVVKTYSTVELMNLLPNLIKIDEHNKEVIKLLSQFFAADEAFEQTEGMKLTKGIILFGGVGVGKTTLMRAFGRNQRASYVLRMCREIEDEFSMKDGGDRILKQYSAPLYPKDIVDNPFGHRAFGICFDDLGTEPLSKFYGKDANVMAEIILNRYDKELPNIMTHITTNLSVKEIEDKYGSRVTDRMREMFNLISFPPEAKSRRV